MTTKATLHSTNPEERGLSFEEIKADVSEALDLFTGVTQEDIAAGRIDIAELPREEQIQLIVDGQTSSVLGSSPWEVGVSLDQSVATQIHADKGATLVFGIEAGFLDAAQAAVRSVRYALVWDDRIIAETGTLKVSPIGRTFQIIGMQDVPEGRQLTLWVTDGDLRVALLRQGTREDLAKITDDVVGKIGAEADKEPNPIENAFNKFTTLVGATQIGGLVVLIVAAIVVVVVVRSEAGKDIAKSVKEVVT